LDPSRSDFAHHVHSTEGDGRRSSTRLDRRLLSRGVLKLPHVASGKVREIYEIDSDSYLFVATDRISAYDVILDQLIPDKGRVLTGVSLHFFDYLDAPNHLISTDLSNVPALSDQDRSELAGRAMIVRKAEVIPVECVVRGYLYGSSWREYREGGGPTTEHLPSGLSMAAKLPEPIFTPATKSTTGHDENITEAQTRGLLGDALYEELKTRSIDIYARANDYAAERGVILADTKFEFGHANGELLLIDEVLTPDSSRYWPADEWVPGKEVPSFDKQYVRDWLETQSWDKTPPPPTLPDHIVSGTASRYIDAYERITGHKFDHYLAGTQQ
jgi:phosphoribosylaminoimidazole-succinocarboxamide synthase